MTDIGTELCYDLSMHIDTYLAPLDAGRVSRVLNKLHSGGLTDYALTGGLALEASLGSSSGRQRPLNDIDIVVSSFADIPSSLGEAFFVRHAHPGRAKGKLVAQLIDPDEALRLDIFSTYGFTMDRCRRAQIGNLIVKMVAVEDIASRLAAEMMSCVRGVGVSRKCAGDYRRIVTVLDPSLVELVWLEHRKGSDPETFAEARTSIEAALQNGECQFIEQLYSQDLEIVCPHCENKAPFQLVAAETMLTILGYC